MSQLRGFECRTDLRVRVLQTNNMRSRSSDGHARYQCRGANPSSRHQRASIACRFVASHLCLFALLDRTDPDAASQHSMIEWPTRGRSRGSDHTAATELRSETRRAMHLSEQTNGQTPEEESNEFRSGVEVSRHELSEDSVLKLSHDHGFGCADVLALSSRRRSAVSNTVAMTRFDR
jgi:hypothetical protein